MRGTMRAIVKSQPRPGAEYRKDWPIPEIGPKDVLARILATAVCGTDVHIYDWNAFAQAHLKLPTTFGHEFCGEVVEVGSQVENIKVGDLIAGETHIPCGTCFQCTTGLQHICQNMKIVGVHTAGSFAEYLQLPAVCAWKLPAGFDPAIGSVLEPLGVAAHAALLGPLSGQTVAVFGCGPIGCFAVAIAAASGAARIFASDVDETRLALAREMGATDTLNARETNVRQAILDATHGVGVDVVLEISAAPSAIQDAFKVVRKAGRLTLVGLQGDPVPLNIANDFCYKETRVQGITGREMWGTWHQVMRLLESGKVDPTKVITHRLPLEEFEQGINLAKSRAGGKVVFML